MEKDKIIKKVEEFSEKYCKQDKEDPKLYEIHVQLVRKFALQLAKMENADGFVVEVASLLHDIGKYNGREGHDIRSYELSKEFLRNFDIPKEKRQLILKCISKHSSRFSKEDNEIEVKIIQSSDALAVLFDDYWQEFSRKSLPKDELHKLYEKTENKINLDSARKIAKPQIMKLKKILNKS